MALAAFSIRALLEQNEGEKEQVFDQNSTILPCSPENSFKLETTDGQDVPMLSRFLIDAIAASKIPFYRTIPPTVAPVLFPAMPLFGHHLPPRRYGHSSCQFLSKFQFQNGLLFYSRVHKARKPDRICKK